MGKKRVQGGNGHKFGRRSSQRESARKTARRVEALSAERLGDAGATVQALVIDADVARSACNPKLNPGQLGSTCGDILNAAFAGGFGIAMDDQLLREWQKHASAYSRLWLMGLVNRGRTVSIAPSSANRTLLGAAIASLLSGAQATAATKDIHLADCAIQSHKRIVSRDAIARGHYVTLASHPSAQPLLTPLYWALGDSTTVTWIGAGAPANPTLGL